MTKSCSMLLRISAIILVFLINACSAENHFNFTEDTLAQTYGDVVYVSALFRHGDRTVDNPYPTDPYQLPFWPDGRAELTKVGKLHEYELGQWFRKRYENLVRNKSYRYDFLLANSSDVDRTLMSGELFLAGFYPPSEKERWNQQRDLIWQPIPLHTMPQNLDNVIAMQKPCEKYDLELAVLNNSPELEALFEEHKTLFDYVRMHSGFPFSKDDIYSAYDRLWDVYDDLFIEESNNLTLPSWTKEIYPEHLKQVAQFYFELTAYTQEMQRLKGGPMLKHMIQDMVTKRENTHWNRTFHFYSGHDTNVAVLLNTLGVYNYIAPPYSALTVLELREKNDEHYVTVLYRNSSTVAPYLLEIPKCDNPCSLDDFIEATKAVVPGEWDEECDIGFFSRVYYFTPLHIILFILLILLVVGLLLVIVRLHTVRRRHYKNYQSIRDNVLNTSSE